LSTVYGIIKQTGGFVFANSSPGRGSTFAIYLPRCETTDEALPLRADLGEPMIKDLTGQGTIMLVEDDDPVRIFGARALRNKGYRVIEAKSGEAALALIRDPDEEVDLLITDVVMPQMDGPALVREVRTTHPEMKVIFISGYTEDAFRQRLDSNGGIDFLSKPFSLKQLATKSERGPCCCGGLKSRGILRIRNKERTRTPSGRVARLKRLWNKVAIHADGIAPVGQGSDGQAAGFGRGARANRTGFWQGLDYEARIA
jgi:CheY-like chemotaxis protein